MKCVLALLALLAALPSTLQSPRREKLSGRKLLLVSFDGFRWDYLRMYNTSWFHWVAEQGATTSDGSYIPAFPTLTYPNHMTIVTGLHTESHGIIGNTIFDPDAPRSTFSLRNKTALRDQTWYRGEPLWISAEKSGKRTGAFFWPGSEAAFDGVRPKFWKIFDSTIPFRTRVDTVVQWLAREDVSFAALYFEEPDIMGHRYGPISEQVNKTVSQLNTLLGYLIQRLKSERLLPAVNLVLTSDHGMARCNASSVVPIYEQLERRRDLMSIIVGEGGFFSMKARLGKRQALIHFMESLSRRPELAGKFRAYLRANIPERLYFRKTRRIPDVVVLAQEGVFLKPRRPRRPINYPPHFGCHGYDNTLTSMRPFFVARGPQIRPGARVKPFHQVDLYNLLARLVGIHSLPNNGSWDNVAKLYRAGPVFGNVYSVAGPGGGALTKEPVIMSLILAVCSAAIALL